MAIFKISGSAILYSIRTDYLRPDLAIPLIYFFKSAQFSCRMVDAQILGFLKSHT